jgi:hypothetical protein
MKPCKLTGDKAGVPNIWATTHTQAVAFFKESQNNYFPVPRCSHAGNVIIIENKMIKYIPFNKQK